MCCINGECYTVQKQRCKCTCTRCRHCGRCGPEHSSALTDMLTATVVAGLVAGSVKSKSSGYDPKKPWLSSDPDPVSFSGSSSYEEENYPWRRGSYGYSKLATSSASDDSTTKSTSPKENSEEGSEISSETSTTCRRCRRKKKKRNSCTIL